MRTAVHTRKVIDPIAGLKLTGSTGRHTFGVLSSAVMLYGMSLVYGITGETLLSGIREAMRRVEANEAAGKVVITI